MGKEAQNRKVALSPQANALMEALVAQVAVDEFGEIPSLDTTFADIEEFGHLVGCLLGRSIDEAVVAKQAVLFESQQPCPKCGCLCSPKPDPHPLPLQTESGTADLQEPAFRCSQCQRDFFPSADSS